MIPGGKSPHRWAVMRHTFDFYTGNQARSVLSRHKTKAAADKACDVRDPGGFLGCYVERIR